MSRIQSRMLEVNPPTGVNRCILHWEKDKGWLIEMWIGESKSVLGGPSRYIITTTRVIFGIFTALLAVQNKEIHKLEYFDCSEEEILAKVDEIKIEDLKEAVKKDSIYNWA